MKDPLVSVIIPNYNGSRTIRKCVEAVLSNDCANFECIVVDDCSRDKSIDLIRDLNCRIICLDKNSGPANARNMGVKNAKGDIVFFVDSDVVLLPNAISEAVSTLRTNKNVGCVQGVYSPMPANNTFVAKVMAIKKYTDFLRVKQLTCIGGAITALPKKVFLDAGGFDTRFKGADVEDYELGYRVAKKNPLLFNSKIQSRHFFPNLWKACKNFYKRSGQWFSLFVKRKRFDTGAASKKGAISSLLAGLITLSLFISVLWPYFFIMLFVLLLLFIISNKDFFKKSIEQEGIIFMLGSIPILCILFDSALLGATSSLVKRVLGLGNEKK